MARPPGLLDRLSPRTKLALAAGGGAVGALWLGRQFQSEGLVRFAPAVLGALGGYALERSGVAPGLGYGVAAGGLGAALIGRTAPLLTDGAQRGLALTIWDGDGLDEAWANQRQTALAVRPEIILLHFGGIGSDAAASSIARQVRETLGANQRIWIQVYGDGVVTDGPDGLVRFAGAVQRAIRAEGLVWNLERGVRVAGGAQAIQRLYAATRVAMPGVPMGHTAYSNPSVHRDSYPWAAALGGEGFAQAPDFTLPQMYPFGDGTRSGTIDGALMDGLAAGAWGGWQTARANGVLGPRVQVGVYLPGAHVPADALVRAAAPAQLVALWPWHGVYDATGTEAAVRIAARLR